MEQLKRTTSTDSDFKSLVALLDADNNAFYAQFNGIVRLKHCVVHYIDNLPVGCGAFKPFNETTIEVKRMFGVYMKIRLGKYGFLSRISEYIVITVIHLSILIK